MLPPAKTAIPESADDALPTDVAKPRPVQVAGHEWPAIDDSSLSLQCLVETDFERMSLSPAEWDDAVIRLQGPIYMTYDWLRTWWEYYGKGRRLRVFLFRHQDRLVALIPVYLESFGYGFCKTVLARLVGSNIPPKTFNPPVDPAWAPAVFSVLLKRLFVGDRCHLLSFGPVSQAWPAHQAFQKACAEANDCVDQPVFRPYGVQTRFRFPATFEEYLASLSSTERKNRMKRLRHLEKSHQISVDTVSDAQAVREEFQLFVRQHARQWHTAGKGGHFEAWPEAEAFNRELVKRQSAHSRVRFFRMLADGEVVVSRYVYQLGGTLFSELPARAVGPHWDKLGIGSISMLKFNEQVIAAGISEVDSGLGEYDHKTQMGGEGIPVGIWQVAGKSRTCRLKVRFLFLVSRIVRLLFHKIWYRRIVPRLPGRSFRSQSLFWLRFDF